jgi:glucose/arabinose dehydrogenase
VLRRWCDDCAIVNANRRIVAFVAGLGIVAGGVGAAVSFGRGAHAAGAGAGAAARLVRVGMFDRPVFVTGAPGDRAQVFVVQQTGQIIVLNHGHAAGRPFLDLSGLVYTQGSDEQGLLGLAFSPDYAENGLFYVDYTVADNDIKIVQYQRSQGNPDIADATSAHLVLLIDHHLFANHNSGMLAFGPDGDLYIGVGDGGSEDDPDGNGQNTDTLLGKILRIAPSPGGGYTVPAGNPFTGQSGKRAEIWAYGLRNPWRFSFDRQTGALIIGDVGQDLQEEIDYAAPGKGAGANYGWSIWEGDRRNKPGRAPGSVFPVLVLKHSAGYCAIIGGYVVRDPTLGKLDGRYLFGDNCRSQIESVNLSHGHASGLRATGLRVSGTSSFGEDTSGRIYITSIDGPVYRLAAS